MALGSQCPLWSQKGKTPPVVKWLKTNLQFALFRIAPFAANGHGNTVI